MTLVADRFVRFDDGTVRDLATGEQVTLIELTLTSAAEQVARRDYCVARLEAQGRESGRASGGCVARDVVCDAHAPPLERPGGFALVDFALIGESLWIEAYRTTAADAATSREPAEWRSWGGWGSWGGWRHDTTDGLVVAGPARADGLRIVPVVDAISATLDGLGSRDVHRFYVKAPDHARLDTFHAVAAREARARGFIPLSSAVVSTWPAIVPLLAARSIVLFGDARCVFSSFGNFGSVGGFGSLSGAGGIGGATDASGAIARAISLLYRTACFVTAIVARVCNHVSVAALRLMPQAATPRAAVACGPASVRGAISQADPPLRTEPEFAEAAWPRSVVQPPVAISYDDPDLPSLFPRTDQIAQVAETATFAAFAFDASDRDAGTLLRPGWQSITTLTHDDLPADTTSRNGANACSGRTIAAARAAPTAVIKAVIVADAGRATGREQDGAPASQRFLSNEQISIDTFRPEAVTPESAADSDSEAASEPNTASNIETTSGFETTSEVDAGARYPPLRLVARRTKSKPVERAPSEIPVVTTMVSGYGEAVDVLVGRGRWAAAARALRAEVAAHERRKHRYDAARTSIALGRLHLAMSEIGPARRCFDRAGELASMLGSALASRNDSHSHFDSAEYADVDYAADYGRVEYGGVDYGTRLIGEALRWSGIAALEDADLERGERLLRSALAAIGPEADPHQGFAIELSLARCLFWQGRGREVVLPSLDTLSPRLSATTPLESDAPRDEDDDGVGAVRGTGHGQGSRPGLDPGLGSGLGSGPGSWTSVGVLAGRFKRGELANPERVATSERIATPEHVATREHIVLGRAAPAGGASTRHDALATAILRVERWRRAARIALAEGDLSTAGDAIARACRIARGDDEDDVRSLGCQPVARSRRASSARTGARAGAGAGANARPDTVGHSTIEQRIRAALRAACHLDAARLQFAIGDTSSGDVHLRESLALARAPARIARVQLLQLARFRNIRTSEARRRFERLSAALRQPRTPRLVRIQARYLVDPRSRRAMELVTFLDRHGDTALAGSGRPDRGGGSPMLEAFQDVLRICHETPDDLTALAQVSVYLRDQLRALSVAIYGAPPGRVATPAQAHVQGDGGTRLVSQGAFEADQKHEHASPSSDAVVVRYAVAGSTRVLSPELAARAIDSGLVIPPTYRPDALDAAAPVRYGGAPIGAIVVRWSIDAAIDHTNASALISVAAAAVSPHLRAALDREALDRQQPEAGPAGADSRASARTPTLGLLGISSAIDTLRHTITRVASAPFHVLIEGESGSGKELVARALHQRGPRRHRRFCAVNCAAFTDELLEAELFGHTRGAFTGALTERAGLFEEADGGTLFLDEIGELSPRGQAKLLRVIQDGETRRVGENLPRRVDTRIVAATNRSLRDEAEAGQFRADLLYRLDVIRITVPPLRARSEDVPVLARAFWDEAIARLGSRATLDPATLTALARYHWPGNVRELHNAIMALAVHAPPRGRVTPSMLPAPFRAPDSRGAANDDAAGRTNGADDELPSFEGPLEDARRAFESRYIRAALARAGGSPSRAAHSLGLTRQGLKKLMARLGIENDRTLTGQTR